MKTAKIINAPDWVMREEEEIQVELSKDVYLERNEELVLRMRSKGLDFVVIYGNREHFANMEYFTKYDCRFEEALYIVAKDGSKTIVVGNEGIVYSSEIPFDLSRVVYKPFSLQGQDRHDSPRLHEIFGKANIGTGSAVGVVGFKYFEPGQVDDPLRSFDVPEYIMLELYRAVSKENVINFTEEITGLPSGVRMQIRRAEEVAVINYQAIRAANVIKRMIKNLRPGISEIELSRLAQADFSPTQMFPFINLTEESVARALRSPSSTQVLELGSVMGLCYSKRGSLCSKVGVAAYDRDSMGLLKENLETFYMQHWLSVAAWYETVRVGVTGGEIYDKVMSYVGDAKFNVSLNPGHYIGMDEWVNSNVFEGSDIPVLSGSHLQSDIIATSKSPVMTSICEDTVIVADENLRAKIAGEYPDLQKTIETRQARMRQVLNINVSDDLLPMSNFCGVMFPFLLNTGKIYAK